MKVLKNKEGVRNCHRPNAVGDALDWVLEQKEDINRETDGIKIKSGVQFIVIASADFSV